MHRVCISRVFIAVFFLLACIQCSAVTTTINIDGADIALSKEGDIQSFDSMQVLYTKNGRSQNARAVGIVGYILYITDEISEISKTENGAATVGYTIMVRTGNNGAGVIKAEIDRNSQEKNTQLILKQLVTGSNLLDLRGSRKALILFVSRA